MATFRHMSDLPDLAWSGGDLVSTLTAYANIFIFCYSPKLKSLITWSDNAERVLGVKDSKIARDGNLFLRHVHPDDRFLLMTDLEKALSGQGLYRATYRWIRPDNNQVRWFHCRAALSQKPGEKLFEGMLIDLSDEFTGGISKIAGPDSISTVLEAFPIMVFTLDRDLRVVRVNRAKEQSQISFGDPAFRHENFKIGKLFLECFSSAEQSHHLAQALEKVCDGTLSHHRTRIFEEERVHNLELLPLMEGPALQGVLCMITDTTELAQRERELAELQKTEGLRLLAAGVSHHFNNSLQGIIGHASVINTHSDNPELVRQASQSIMDIVNKTSGLSKQLFVFEDSQRTQLSPVDLNLSVMAAINRIENLFSSGFKVGVVFGNPSSIMGRQTELIEALEAVLKNAKDAMLACQRKNAHLSVKTYDVTLKELEVSDLRPGDYAKITITDSGSGMDPETQRRCFEPFFSTKDVDQRSGVSLSGGGLGLSKAFAIIREFGGAIVAETQAGLGTCISIFLPVSTSEGGKSAQNLYSVDRSHPPTILLVDDDLMVLRTVQALLKDMGYSCVAADDCNRALGLVRTFTNSLQLVILDALMPGMDGATVLGRIKEINPSLKVVGFSGAAPEHTRPLIEAGAITVIRKPVDPRSLREVVEQVLAGKEAA